MSDKSRSQLEVYFNGEPTIDYEALANFINACDPEEEDRCEVEAVAPGDPRLPAMADGLKIGGALLKLGDFTVFVLSHNVPSPWLAGGAIDHMPPRIKKELAGHKGFALLNLYGGEDYAPIERMVCLLKIAIGLLQQAGTGIGFFDTGRAYPKGFIDELIADVGDTADLWLLLRDEQQPIDLLTLIGRVEVDGKRWLVTTGHQFFGLPDFAWQITSKRDEENFEALFYSAFCYMLINGPVLNPGETFGYDETALVRFFEPTEEQKWLERGENKVLVFVAEKAKKKG
jgi:hypothetical protein